MSAPVLVPNIEVSVLGMLSMLLVTDYIFERVRRQLSFKRRQKRFAQAPLDLLHTNILDCTAAVHSLWPDIYELFLFFIVKSSITQPSAENGQALRQSVSSATSFCWRDCRTASDGRRAKPRHLDPLLYGTLVDILWSRGWYYYSSNKPASISS